MTSALVGKVSKYERKRDGLTREERKRWKQGEQIRRNSRGQRKERNRNSKDKMNQKERVRRNSMNKRKNRERSRIVPGTF